MIAYWRERFPVQFFLPLAVVLAGAARRSPSLSPFAADTGLTLLLLAQFRLWDDLSDRGRDAVRHPNRVLVRAPIQPFVLACIALGSTAIAVVALRAGSPVGLRSLALLDAAFAIFYGVNTGRSAAGDLFRLVKYPVIVLIVGGGASVFTGAAMAAVFLGACVYEVWHDETSPIRAWIGREVDVNECGTAGRTADTIRKLTT